MPYVTINFKGAIMEQPQLDHDHEERVFERPPHQEITLGTGVRWLGARAMEFIRAIPVGHPYERKD